MKGLVILRIVYGFAVSYGVWAAFRTLLDMRKKYAEIVEDRINGSALFLAHSHVRTAWLTLYIQTALLGILILGAFIPIHPWHEEGAVARGWITVLHTTLTIVSTVESIRVRRDRKVISDMMDFERHHR